MTHDPLCPQGNGDGIITTAGVGDFPCLCDLIAKVRADELRRPSEDGWMSVRAVLAWEDQVRAEEREKAVQRVKDAQRDTLAGVNDFPMSAHAEDIIAAAIRGGSNE